MKQFVDEVYKDIGNRIQSAIDQVELMPEQGSYNPKGDLLRVLNRIDKAADAMKAKCYTKGGEVVIKFIEYTGVYPHLCTGCLVIEVNGDRYSLINILSSGGGFDAEYEAVMGPWQIDKEALPAELRPLVKKITKLINKNVPFGCCGGCT